MYNTTQDYKEKILNDSTQHELNIYIDGSKIDENHIINFKTTLELFNNNEFCLGCTPEIDIEFEIDKRDLTLKWRGSSNQRVIDVQESLKQGKIVLYCD